MSIHTRFKRSQIRIAGMPFFLVGGMAPLAVIAVLSVGKAENLAQPRSPESQVEQSYQGDWTVVASQIGGQRVSAEELKSCRVSIQGDSLTYIFGNEPGDRRTGPGLWNHETNGLDWQISELDIASHAIYEMRGDTLKIGFGNFGVDGLIRPQQWDMGEGQVAWLLVLKRDQPAEPAAADTTVSR